MLQASSVGDDGAGQDPFQRLCFPDRNEIYRSQMRCENHRGAYCVCEPRIGNEQDERRNLQRGAIRSDSSKSILVVQEVPEDIGREYSEYSIQLSVFRI